MDSEWEQCCPLCITPFTEQDRQFRPCTCSFRMCLWCWHTVVTLAKSEHQEAACPQCRGLYDMAAIQAQHVRLAKPRASRKAVAARSHLANVVLNDKRVVAVRNIPACLIDGAHAATASVHDGATSDAAAASPEQRVEAVSQHFLFGQYGRIVGAVVVRAQHGDRHLSSCVYHAAIRFSTSEEASRCVRHVDRVELCGSMLSCAQVPTRYCSNYLLKTMCSKKMCVELHQENTNKALVVAGQTAAGFSLLGAPTQSTSMWLNNNAAPGCDASTVEEEDPAMAVSDRTLNLACAWVAKNAACLFPSPPPSCEPQGATSCGDSFGPRQRTDASVASDIGTPASTMRLSAAAAWGVAALPTSPLSPGDAAMGRDGGDSPLATPMTAGPSHHAPSPYDAAFLWRTVAEAGRFIAAHRKDMVASHRSQQMRKQHREEDAASLAAMVMPPRAILNALCSAMPPNIPAGELHATLPHPAAASKRK